MYLNGTRNGSNTSLDRAVATMEGVRRECKAHGVEFFPIERGTHRNNALLP